MIPSCLIHISKGMQSEGPSLLCGYCVQGQKSLHLVMEVMKLLSDISFTVSLPETAVKS